MAVLNTFIVPGWARHGLKSLSRALSAVFAPLIFIQMAWVAHGEISKEYQVKAVFLFNFTQFIEWPTNTFPGAKAPLTIGVLGTDPFGNFLEETVHDESASGHPIIVKHFQRVADIDSCQILFISTSETKRIKTVLGALKGRKVLTVSDIEGFARSGGMVRFVTEQNKIHFRINLEAVKAAGLTVSSKLLRLAEIIEPGKE
jgi:hypothetical protein